MADVEITIIGAGVVGLAAAARLSAKHPRLLVLERNRKFGLETSSRNSEVIHAGIYYPPGSLRARLCVEGRDQLYRICTAHGIPHRKITKIITATNDGELEALEALFQNGVRNGVELKRLGKEETLSLEPNIRTVGSIFSPLTGIVSVHDLMDHFYHEAVQNGATVHLMSEVSGITKSPDGYTITVKEGKDETVISSEVVVNSAGLCSDSVAAMAGIDLDSTGYRLTFAKGSYFAVTPSKAALVSRLVYPVPRNEGLGVHALIDWGGRLRFGPDLEYLNVTSNFDYAVSEDKRAAFGESIRRIVPAIRDEDITPDMSGVRPKLQKRGGPPRDFVIQHEKDRGLEGFVNLVGIDSPGLTAAPAIAAHVERLLYG